MRNRFNINESEKNRIRDLHGMQVLTEQDTTPEERRKISKEDYLVIMRNLRTKLRPYVGKTVNLWTTTISGELTTDGPGTVEGDEMASLGSWTIDYAEPWSDLDERAGEDTAIIIFYFKFRSGPEDSSRDDVLDTFIKNHGEGAGSKEVSALWECGDEFFMANIGTSDTDKFTNVKLINKLNSELCKTNEFKEYSKLFSVNGNYVVTDMDVDFSMGDEDIETLA